MLPRTPVPAELRALALRQANVLSRSQALGFVSDDVVRRFLDDGRWHPVARGIYTVTEAPLTFLGRCWAASLAGGQRGVIGVHAAARLLGLTSAEPDVIDVFVGLGSRRAQTGVPWRFIRAERRGRGEPCRTLMEDTVWDIAATMQREADVFTLLADVVSGRRTTPARLRECLDARGRHPWRRVATLALEEVADGVHSVLEQAYRRDVEVAHGLPRGRRQVQLAGRADVYYPEFGVVVELDGRLGHVGSGRFRDMQRDNSNILADRATLRFGHLDVHANPCETAQQVGSLLVARGWSGIPTPCPRCVRAHAV